MSESQEPSVYRPADDEIDLFDLVEGIWAEKYLILAIFAACLVAAVVAIQFMTPVYKATAYVLPPSENDIQDMNLLNRFDETATRHTVQTVFNKYLERLNSRELKKTVFDQFNLARRFVPDAAALSREQLATALEKAVVRFNEYFSVTPPGRNASSQETGVSVSFPGMAPEDVAAILNETLTLARTQAIQELHSLVLAEKSARLQKLSEQIQVLRQTAKERQLDRVAQINEAIQIARRLEIAEPRFMGPSVEVQGVLNQGLPLYYLGYRLLEAEKEVIANRENNDPFIEGLRDLQQQHMEISALAINAEGFQVVRIEQPALPPSAPEKPKPKLIIALAAVMGLMVGVFVALVRRAIINRRELVHKEASV